MKEKPSWRGISRSPSTPESSGAECREEREVEFQAESMLAASSCSGRLHSDARAEQKGEGRTEAVCEGEVPVSGLSVRESDGREHEKW